MQSFARLVPRTVASPVSLSFTNFLHIVSLSFTNFLHIVSLSFELFSFALHSRLPRGDDQISTLHSPNLAEKEGGEFAHRFSSNSFVFCEGKS